ncbi:MAG TPA: DUF2252 family protein [Candidatus Sulfotelmatobacter sp.]|jgi:hypothetical protein|nr:DUF2252 family protein [Candidatus Sulfotelmatobacter sp.]
MNIVKATRQYEEWLGHRTNLIQKDLQRKHASMKAGIFPFLRATYYRWAQMWPQVCPDLAQSPHVLAVGDLHVENFGTWRDIEGRLIWGVNDFDEAYPMGYANDLVRLAVSAHLAVEAGHLPLKPRDICDAILDGYEEALRVQGSPFVLEEKNDWLRKLAINELREPVPFWAKMDAIPAFKGTIPLSATDALEHLLPAHGLKYRVIHRIAGLGSLGRQRYVAIANWNGGRIAREAKALVASACHWACDHKGPTDILYQMIIGRAVRCPDPFVQLRGRWIVRRLSPHCCRVELSTLHVQGEELRLLRAMGSDTANVHLGTNNSRKAILDHMRKQKRKWLHRHTEAMIQCVREDWKTWGKHGYD